MTASRFRHNGGPPLDDVGAAVEPPSLPADAACLRCVHWHPPSEREESDYRAWQGGYGRRVREPSGHCFRVMHRHGGMARSSGKEPRARNLRNSAKAIWICEGIAVPSGAGVGHPRVCEKCGKGGAPSPFPAIGPAVARVGFGRGEPRPGQFLLTSISRRSAGNGAIVWRHNWTLSGLRVHGRHRLPSRKTPPYAAPRLCGISRAHSNGRTVHR